MSPVVTIKDAAWESQLFRGRSLVAAVCIAVMSLLLAGRMAHLQVLEHAHFATLSEDNRVKVVPVPPTRGLIFDRNGIVLAENVATFSLELVPEAGAWVRGQLRARETSAQPWVDGTSVALVAQTNLEPTVGILWWVFESRLFSDHDGRFEFRGVPVEHGYVFFAVPARLEARRRVVIQTILPSTSILTPSLSCPRSMVSGRVGAAGFVKSSTSTLKRCQ